MPDFIPRPDPDFNNFTTNSLGYINGHLTDFGLVAGDVADVNAKKATWDTKYPAHQAAQTAANSARQAKDDARNPLEAAFRSLAKSIQAKPSVTAASKQAAGLTVPDTTPTPVGPPTTAPIARIDSGQRLEHVVHFSDTTTPTSKAKPAGVMGCEIWVKVGGPPPIDPSELHFLALDTKTPYEARFDGADGGKPAHYMARWVNSRGEKGPWSPTSSATIGG